ncbi:hypothetical protein ACTQ32_15835, partial [Roseburia faecis]
AAFCGLSFLLAIKITSKLSNFILHQFEGLHKLWDAPVHFCFTIVFCSNPFIFVIKEHTNKAMNFIVVLML